MVGIKQGWCADITGSSCNIPLSLQINGVLYTFELSSILWHSASSSVHISHFEDSTKSLHYWFLVLMALVPNRREYLWWVFEVLESVTKVVVMVSLVLLCALMVSVEHLCCLVVAVGHLLVVPPEASVWMILDWQAALLIRWIFYSWYSQHPVWSGPSRLSGFFLWESWWPLSFAMLAIQDPTTQKQIGSADVLGVVILCGHTAQTVSASAAAWSPSLHSTVWTGVAWLVSMPWICTRSLCFSWTELSQYLGVTL